MRKSAKKKYSLPRYLALILVVLAALAVGVFYLLASTSTPQPTTITGLEVDSLTGNVLYEVPRDISLASLAQDLESKGLIAHGRTFRYFLRLTRRDKKIKAGYFYMRPSNSVL